jgi:hypothetical protein
MTEEPRRPVTKGDIIEKGLDAFPADQFKSPIAHEPAMGAVSAVFLPYVIEVAKLMSTGGEGVPEHCRANPGMCLRICFQAVQWQFEPFGVADQTFIINHRLHYQSGLIHAVIEKRAPLSKRLEIEYTGDKANGTRACIVTGTFRDGEVRIYESPIVANIKPKNSPLWVTDVDQQLAYFGFRSWARKWCPDILLGVYTQDEESGPLYQDDIEVDTGLRERLAASEPTGEGHQDGHAARELAQLAPDTTIEPEPSAEPQRGPRVRSRPQLVSDTGRRLKPTRKPAKGGRRPSSAVKLAADRAERSRPRPSLSKEQIKAAADRAEGSTEPAKEPRSPTKAALPRTVDQYMKWAENWIEMEESIITLGTRWREEIGLRNRLGMTSEDRGPLEELLRQRKRRLEAEMLAEFPAPGAEPPDA